MNKKGKPVFYCEITKNFEGKYFVIVEAINETECGYILKENIKGDFIWAIIDKHTLLKKK